MSRNLDELFALVDEHLEEDGIASFLREARVWLVGCSGGGDSVFLLRWCAARSAAFGGARVVAVHLHHGIRGDEADGDLAFCRSLCESLHVTLKAEKRDVPAIAAAKGVSLETAAREARYALFRQAAYDDPSSVLLTAHTADDQLETVLERLLRGTGTRGLGGIAPASPGELPTLRPLLRLSGGEIRAALTEAGLPFVNDSSNSDPIYTRNYLRKTVVPALRRLSPDPAAMAVRSAALCRADEACLEQLALEAAGSGNSVCLDRLRSLHRAVASRVIRLLCGRASKNGMKDVEERHVTALLAAVSEVRHYCLDLPLGRTARVDPEAGVFTVFRRERPDAPTPFSVDLPAGSIASVPGYAVFRDRTAEKGNPEKNIYKFAIQRRVEFDTMKGRLSVRNRRPGDVYRLDGMTRQVRKLLQEAGLPPEERWRLPLLCQGDRILWIPGLRPSDEAAGDGSAEVTVCRLSD